MDTKLNKYELRSTQRRLVEVIDNPENFGKSVTKICRLAKINRGTYYNIMRDKNFINIKDKLIQECLSGKIEQVINATFNFAITNYRCFNDRKMLLTMAGLYSDKQQIKADIEGSQDINVNKKVID